jgi:hypothetical protein
MNKSLKTKLSTNIKNMMNLKAEKHIIWIELSFRNWMRINYTLNNGLKLLIQWEKGDHNNELIHINIFQ